MPNCWLWGGQNSRKLCTSARSSFFSSSPRLSTWFCRSSMETRQPSPSPLPSLSIFHMMRAASLARRKPQVLAPPPPTARRGTEGPSKFISWVGNCVQTDQGRLSIRRLMAGHHPRVFEGKGDAGLCPDIYVLVWRSATDPPQVPSPPQQPSFP